MKRNHVFGKWAYAAGLAMFALLLYLGRAHVTDLPADSPQEAAQTASNETIPTNAPSQADDSDTVQEENPEGGEAIEGETPDPGAAPSDEPTPSPVPTPVPTPTLHPTDWDYMDIGFGNMAYPEDAPTTDFPYEIRINKRWNTVTVYGKNPKGKYNKPVKAMVCSVGRATPLGTFQLKEKYYWKSLIHGVWGQYSTRITGRVLFHSVPYSAPEKDKLLTNLYRQLGSTASAGCVRLTTIDAKWILENCPTGTNVVICDESEPGPLGKPDPPQITTSLGWDPTDPDTRNPLNLKSSQLKGVKNRTVERGSQVNYMQGVIAFDKESKTVSNNVKIKTDLDAGKVGAYPVTYVFTDSTGKNIRKKATFTVKDTTPPHFSGLPSYYYVKKKEQASKENLLSLLRVTDNDAPMDLADLRVDMPNSIREGTNAVRFSLTDAYGNAGTFTCHVVLVTKPPTLTFKQKNKEVLPLSQKVNKEFARKRVDVKDGSVRLTPNDVAVAITKQKWGYKIRYSVSNKAGYSAHLSEKISYDTYRLEVKASNVKTVSSPRAKDELLALVKVKSNTTDKAADAKVKVAKTKKSGSDESYDYYEVTYQCTYRSPLGSKTATAKTRVRVPRAGDGV